MCTYMHKIILIKEYFNNIFYFIYYIYRTRYIFWCYDKRASLVRVCARSTIVLDPLSGAMVNGRAWFVFVLDPQYGVWCLTLNKAWYSDRFYRSKIHRSFKKEKKTSWTVLIVCVYSVFLNSIILRSYCRPSIELKISSFQCKKKKEKMNRTRSSMWKKNKS